MRLNLILPHVEPDEFELPKTCPRKGCRGRRFMLRQRVRKNLVDTEYRAVTARRYACCTCGHVFRVYPKGVSRKHISQRVMGLAIILYLLGLSYGAVAIVLTSLGIGIGKTSVYRAVQAVSKRVPGLKREALVDGYRTVAVGADVTYLRCGGKVIAVGVVLDAVHGVVLSIDRLEGEDAEHLQAWLEPILEAVGAEVLVSDDADAFKQVADRTGRGHQVCKSHVVRNTEAWVAEMEEAIRRGGDGSLEALGITPEQALADLERMKRLVHTRRPEDQEQVEALAMRYAQARSPGKGQKQTIAYRIRNLFLDRWNVWPRLTLYRRWKDENGKPWIDGSNNACERAIGWWIKERYRTMRGYKREASALGVSRLMALAGNHLDRGLRLADLMA